MSPNEKALSTVSYLAHTRLQHTVHRQQGSGILIKKIETSKSEAGIFDPQKSARSTVHFPYDLFINEKKHFTPQKTIKPHLIPLLPAGIDHTKGVQTPLHHQATVDRGT